MLVRDRAPRGIEVYLMRRSARSSFVPDAYVFPGGAVDLGDRSPRALAQLIGAPEGVAPELAVAVLRELFEEAGVLFVCRADGRPADLGAADRAPLRRRLRAGTALAELLDERGLALDARPLIYYSNWITPPTEPLRFDAHFFVARAPAGQEPSADAYEVHDGRWLAPDAALAQAERGELSMVFPTVRHLERLARYATVAQLEAAARGRRVVAVMPEDDAGSLALPAGFEEW